MANILPLKVKEKAMNFLLSPVFANVYYVGGGALGLILVIIVVVLLLRR